MGGIPASLCHLVAMREKDKRKWRLRDGKETCTASIAAIASLHHAPGPAHLPTPTSPRSPSPTPLPNSR